MFGRKQPEKPEQQLVCEAAYSLVGCHTEEFRAMTRDAKVQAIFEYHEGRVSRETITNAIELAYTEMQGQPAEDTEPVERDA